MTRLGATLIAALCAVVMVGALFVYLRGPGGPQPLSVLEVEGDVTRQRDASTEPAAVGMVLQAGDELRTGRGGAAVIARGSRAPLRLEGSTTVRIEAVSDDVVEVRLREGRIRAKVRPDASALRVLQGRRSVLATDAEVRIASEEGRLLSVEPERGEVAVTGVPGAGRVVAGTRLVDLEGKGARILKLSAEPLLDVVWPRPQPADKAVVSGSAEPGSRLEIVLGTEVHDVDVDLDGRFSVEVRLPPGETVATVRIEDPMGRTKTQRGTLARVEDRGGRPAFQLELP